MNSSKQTLQKKAEEYFSRRGYLIFHLRKNDLNINFISVNKNKKNISRVVVGVCKNYPIALGRAVQMIAGALRPAKRVGLDEQKAIDYRTQNLHYPEWSSALKKKVAKLTGEDRFMIYLCAPKILGDGWIPCARFMVYNLPGCKISTRIIN